MTKAEIVQAVYTRLGGFSKKESADLVDLVFETMKETLGRGEKI
jgi:integration host factor subunit alpha